MSRPALLTYLPEAAAFVLQKQAEAQRPLSYSPEVARAALRGAVVTALGGGLGYAAGKALSRKVGPSLPPEALGALGAAVAGALAGAQAHQDRRFMEVLRRADEGRKNRTPG